MNPINLTGIQRHEIICVGDVNQSILYALLMISLALIFVKSINIEKIIENKIGEKIDFGMMYAISIAVVCGCLMFISYFAPV